MERAFTFGAAEAAAQAFSVYERPGSRFFFQNVAGHIWGGYRGDLTDEFNRMVNAADNRPLAFRRGFRAMLAYLYNGFTEDYDYLLARMCGCSVPLDCVEDGHLDEG